MKNYSLTKKIGLVLGPILFLILLNVPFEMISAKADPVIAVAAWMITWWVTEAVSISVTALIPLTIFPLVGIMDVKTVGPIYGSSIIWLFFGGFVIALAMEKVQLHRRIALNIIKITGTTPDRVVLGFMIATATLSMWISNTATTVLMLPIALSVINLLIDDADGFTKQDKNFALSIMLGIAFAANVGGIATVIGTPPNVVMIGFVEETYDIEIPFFNWMLMGVPFTCIMLALIYVVLVKWIYPNHLPEIANSKQLIDNELAKLGEMSGDERRVLIVFFSAIFLWVFEKPVEQFFNLDLSSATISLLAAFALFAVPYSYQKGEFSLEWRDTEKLPWGILILFGGGLALATAMKNAEIIQLIGDFVAQNRSLSIFGVTAALITIMLFMTELMSNVALVAIFAPVIAGIALGLETDMLGLLIPITMASSCAFMLPMATPPNAIVFASGHIQVAQMVRAGVILNVLAVLLLIAYAYFVIPLVF
ncbi:MAG: DASS family sodium-coupled anion symporter [Saprospiraceae bacterium]